MNIKKIAFITIGLFCIYAGVVVAISHQDEIKSQINSLASSIPQQESAVSDSSTSVPHVGGEQTVVKDSPSVGGESNADLAQLENVPVKKPSINELIGSDLLRNAITLGLGLFAFMQWINYFASFDPARAFSGVVAPAVATFLSFKWPELLSWFQIGL